MNLSIIIPIYNGRKYLNECLESIVKEIDNSVEIILINDGSPEYIDDIIKKYKNYNIKYFKKEHSGVSSARNFGLKKSSGKWIMFVDADDILTNSWYQEISNYFENNSDIIYFSTLINNDNKEKILDSMMNLNNNNPFMINIASKLYRRKFIFNNKVQFKEGVINGEDQLFNLESIIKAKKYKVVNKNIYFYRNNLDSSTHIFKEEIFSSCCIYLHELKRILNENSILKKELYIEQSIKGILCTLINRISLLNLKLQKKYITILKKDKQLNNYLKNFKISKIKSKHDLIVILLMNNLYYLAISMFVGKKVLKKAIRSLTKKYNKILSLKDIYFRNFNNETKTINITHLKERRLYLMQIKALLKEIKRRRAIIEQYNKLNNNDIQINLNIPKLLRNRKKSDTINNVKRR